MLRGLDGHPRKFVGCFPFQFQHRAVHDQSYVEQSEVFTPFYATRGQGEIDRTGEKPLTPVTIFDLFWRGELQCTPGYY